MYKLKKEHKPWKGWAYSRLVKDKKWWTTMFGTEALDKIEIADRKAYLRHENNQILDKFKDGNLSYEHTIKQILKLNKE